MIKKKEILSLILIILLILFFVIFLLFPSNFGLLGENPIFKIIAILSIILLLSTIPDIGEKDTTESLFEYFKKIRGKKISFNQEKLLNKLKKKKKETKEENEELKPFYTLRDNYYSSDDDTEGYPNYTANEDKGSY